jgi:hypothetical protein
VTDAALDLKRVFSRPSPSGSGAPPSHRYHMPSPRHAKVQDEGLTRRPSSSLFSATPRAFASHASSLVSGDSAKGPVPSDLDACLPDWARRLSRPDALVTERPTQGGETGTMTGQW